MDTGITLNFGHTLTITAAKFVTSSSMTDYLGCTLNILNTFPALFTYPNVTHMHTYESHLAIEINHN